MKIYDRSLTGATENTGRSQETQAVGSAGRQSGAGRSSEATDRVEFSSSLGSLSQALSSFGASRGSRVDTLADLYRSGNYSPSSLDTSRGMISDALSGGAD
jgi:hypothetical protein